MHSTGIQIELDKYHHLRSNNFKIQQKITIIQNIDNRYEFTKIFDIGSGTGVIGDRAPRCIYDKLVSFEPEKGLYEYGKKFYHEAHNSIFDPTKLQDSNKNVLVFNDVLHHIPKWKDYLQKLMTVSNGNNFVLIFEPNCINPVTFIHQLDDDGIRLSFPIWIKKKFRKITLESGFIGFGKDKKRKDQSIKFYDRLPMSGIYWKLLKI